MNDQFTIVSEVNLEIIQRRLDGECGIILIAEHGSDSHELSIVDATFHIYASACIDGQALSVLYGQDENLKAFRLDEYKDRRYTLRRPSKPRALSLCALSDDFRTSLALGNGYEFEIRPQLVIRRSVFGPSGITLYMPSVDKLHQSFDFALSYMIDKIERSTSNCVRDSPLCSKVERSSICQFVMADITHGTNILRQALNGQAVRSCIGSRN